MQMIGMASESPGEPEPTLRDGTGVTMPNNLLERSLPYPPGPSTTPQMELAKNSIGTMGIVFFVVAAAAPLTVVVAVFPVILGSGNGLGIVGTFLLVAAVLLVFSVGFVAMS